jgi:hypothetical protein
MSITARQLIEDALHEIGVLGEGQSVYSGVEQRAFRRLNNMIQALSLDNKKIYVNTEDTQTLTAGTARYTIGSGGNFNTGRPLSIYNDAFIRDSGGTDYPLLFRTQDVYRLMLTKDTQSRPRFFSYTPEYPLGKISFFPTPNDSTDVFHYRANVLLTEFATLTTSVDFPPGYELAIMLSLAIGISAQNGKSVSPELVATTAAAWDAIESNNAVRDAMRPSRMDDLNLMGRNWNYFNNNILTGTY